MSLYNRKEWKEFRQNVIEADGNKCVLCGSFGPEVVLQVHHKTYKKGRLPWQYGLGDCETLCKGCHAGEHDIVPPKIGWDYIGEEDLEDLSGTCEYCGTQIRYVFHISHPKAGFMSVGTLCCDNLTDTQIASNEREAQNRFKQRKSRFIKSKRWKIDGKKHRIKQVLFEIAIEEEANGFSIKIHNLKSSCRYADLETAKTKVFDVIESGEFYAYLEKNNIPYPKKK